MIELPPQLPQQLNFDKIEHIQRNLTPGLKQLRGEYRLATNLPPAIDHKRFLPNRDNINPAPQIEQENENNELPLNPQTTKESKSIIKKWLKFFLPDNSPAVRKDIIDCQKAGGNTILIQSSGGEAEIICLNNDGKEVKVDGEPSDFVEKVSALGIETKIGLTLVTNKDGKRVIGFTQNFQNLKKVLFQHDSFVLNEGTTYQEFFGQIKTEIIKNADSVANDIDRCNIVENGASLFFQGVNGKVTITCRNKDGSVEQIEPKNLSPRTFEILENLREASSFGYNTKVEFSSDYKFKIEQIFRPN